jgi:hypothetical protein
LSHFIYFLYLFAPHTVFIVGGFAAAFSAAIFAFKDATQLEHALFPLLACLI